MCITPKKVRCKKVNVTIINALISLIGTLGGTFGGILVSSKLTNYRIEQLEKKVEKHNSIVERMYVAETEIKDIKENLKNLKAS